MWGVIAAVVLLFTLLYAGLLDFYRRQWLALAEWEVPAGYIPEIRISVIVAARNEVGRLQTCLDSLLVQDYPTGLSEILVVDDHSEDGTVAIARTKETPHLRVLELKDAPKAADGKAPFSKKKALEWGIAQARGEFILTTDADCEVPPGWMRSMAFAFEKKGWHCVAGPVVFKERESLFQRFLILDFLGMMLLTGGGYQGGLVHLANGASFGFSMKAYRAVEGYTDNMHISSGDDLFLLHKIMALGFRVGFMKTPSAVSTEAPATLGAFVRQRLRWGTKSTAYKDWRLTAALAIVFFQCWCILFCIPGLVLYPYFFAILFAVQISIKALSDYRMLYEACGYFNKKSLLAIFWPAQGLHVIYIAVIGLAANVFRRYSWKGRQVR